MYLNGGIGLSHCYSADIWYDWAKAQNNVKTLDNAIDSAVALYLDVINLFLRLLGSSKDDN